MVWNHATAKCGGGGRGGGGMCIMKPQGLFCECCREPQYFCAAVRGEVHLRFEESPFSDLKVMLGNKMQHMWRALGPRTAKVLFCLITDTLLCWPNITSLGKLFWGLLVHEAPCNESPSCGKNSRWNRHIISQRGQEGLDVPTSRDCEKFACAYP